MSATRPGEVNNGITTTRVQYSTAGLSVASKCLSAVVGNGGLSNDRDDGPAGKRNKCQPTLEAIEPENTSPTRVPVDSSNYFSMSTTTSLLADATATMILSCPDGFEIRGDMCVPIEREEPKQAIIARSPDGGDSYVGPRINNARTRVRDAVAGQLFPRQSASESITTTITPVLQTPGATDSSPAPSSTSASSSLVSPVTQIITTASPTPTTNSPSVSTLTSIPLLIATGSYSTIYSIPSTIAPASSPTASPNSTSSGLSVGAKAGITVSVVFVVIAIGIFLAMLHIKRRRKLQNNNSSSSRGQKKGKQQAPRTDPGTVEKGISAREHPMMGMEVAMPPGLMIPYTASSSPIGIHPGTKLEIDNSDRNTANAIDTGPHELDVGEKFEMDAGYTGRASTIDSFPLSMSPSASRGVTPSIASRAVTPSIRDRSGSVATNSRGVAPSLRERTSTVGELENISRGVTPMSSFSRGVTPDVNSRGMTSDARMGGGMGHISPLSHTTERTERSFLDLD